MVDCDRTHVDEMALPRRLEQIDGTDQVAPHVLDQIPLLEGLPVEAVVDHGVHSVQKFRVDPGFLVGAHHESADQWLEMISTAGRADQRHDVVTLGSGFPD